MTRIEEVSLSRVARSLQELGLSNIVFVGGATIGLYLTDPAAPEPRHTYDVDVVTPVPNRRAYNQLEARLLEAGHTPDPAGPICRWRISGITVDLMPPDETVLGFSNRWYADLIDHAQEHILTDGIVIRHASTPYLFATKLEAFRGRGKDYYSHDLEDLIAVLDGRDTCVLEVNDSPDDVRTYIAREFRLLLDDDAFHEALPGHLPPDPASQARSSVILERMNQMAA